MTHSPSSHAGPPVDAELAATLRALPGAAPLKVTAATIGRFRAASEAAAVVNADDVLACNGTYEVREIHDAGPEGLTLLVCSPALPGRTSAAVYYLHGGGMIAGHHRSRLDTILGLAAAHGMAVVSARYRLAPEHPDPAPVEDCYAGLCWIADNAAALRIDPARIVVAGISAGGGLAAGVTLMARDRGGPPPMGQLLLCPMLDDRSLTVSARQAFELSTWDSEANRTGWTALLGHRRGGPEVSPYAAPARATDMRSLPPTLIDVGSAEVFRDEAVAYASDIWAAGGAAELHVWSGAVHGHDLLAPHAAVSRATVRARHDWLARLMAAA